MTKLKMQTPDLTSQNIEKIAELFPNCITETVDENGQPKRAVNFPMLKQMLSGEVLDGDEAYEFTWVGKKASIVEANRPIRKTLRPCIEESRNWDETENLYIEGDNLEVLKLLQESYLGKVKMIYIDPPYNTGNDFIYRDDFKHSVAEYDEESGVYDEDENRLFKNTDSNGRFHSDWCSMIYPRLMLARNLLSDDGVIFISIDYNENYNLRTIMNEVFGSSGYIGEIYWESKTKSQNTLTSYNKLQPKAEMILVYSKKNKKRFNLIKKGEKEYLLNDSKGAYREYLIEVMNANGVRGRNSMIYAISDGNTSIMPPEGKQWQLGLEQVMEYKNKNDLYIREGKAYIKMRPEYERNDITEPFWGFFAKELGTTESAKKELASLIDKNGFETVKPVEIIKRLVYHSIDNHSIVLDFFSGSATTAHAVMQLNAEDGGNRKFIMVQLPEPCDEKSEAYKAGYKNICEIGKERIRRAGDKIKTETGADIDYGFRVFKVDESNMNDIYYSVAELNQTTLASTLDNIKADRSALDLLFGCLLDWGLPLSMPYKSEQLGGCTVHTYNEGDLVACFDMNIPEEALVELAKRQPLRAVFRDSCFADSPAKINVFEIFKLYASDCTVKVL